VIDGPTALKGATVRVMGSSFSDALAVAALVARVTTIEDVTVSLPRFQTSGRFWNASELQSHEFPGGQPELQSFFPLALGNMPSGRFSIVVATKVRGWRMSRRLERHLSRHHPMLSDPSNVGSSCPIHFLFRERETVSYSGAGLVAPARQRISVRGRITMSPL